MRWICETKLIWRLHLWYLKNGRRPVYIHQRWLCPRRTIFFYLFNRLLSVEQYCFPSLLLNHRICNCQPLPLLLGRRFLQGSFSRLRLSSLWVICVHVFEPCSHGVVRSVHKISCNTITSVYTVNSYNMSSPSCSQWFDQKFGPQLRRALHVFEFKSFRFILKSFSKFFGVAAFKLLLDVRLLHNRPSYIIFDNFRMASFFFFYRVGR